MASVVVDSQWLHNHLNNPNVKVLDVAFTLCPKPDPLKFREENYGQFEKMLAEQGDHPEYAGSHIPGAKHFNLHIACYPSEFQRFSLYEPEVFEKYVQLLGINEGDKVVVYGRGPGAGMVFAARAFWLFKIYGQTDVVLLNGGLGAWQKAGYSLVAGHQKLGDKGNWTAKPVDREYLITFEELNNQDKGASIFENLAQINYLDARPTEQFTGKAPLGLPAPGATGCRLTGAKPFPLSNLVNGNGLKSKEEIETALKNSGYEEGKPIVLACNGGMQACLAFAAVTSTGKEARIFNGSMMEIGARRPDLINAK